MITSIKSICYRTQCAEIANAIRDLSQLKVVQNLFTEQAFQGIPQWCKKLPNIKHFTNDVLYANPANDIYGPVQFNPQHRLAYPEAYFTAGNPNSVEMNAFIGTLIERFALEEQLVGTHQINVNLYRTTFNELTITDEEYQLGWHYDTSAKSTMVAVFQNDFAYKEGEESGLDIAENSDIGPYHPILTSRSRKPKNNSYISYSYPVNGAIIFQTMQGAIIHRRSIMERPQQINATRTIIQIKLRDLSWKQ